MLLVIGAAVAAVVTTNAAIVPTAAVNRREPRETNDSKVFPISWRGIKNAEISALMIMPLMRFITA